MFLKPLEAQSRGKTLEMIIEKRMQNMVRFENKNITFVYEIHFGKSKKMKNWKIEKPENPQSPKIHLFKDRFKSDSETANRFFGQPRGNFAKNRPFTKQPALQTIRTLF